MKVVVPVIINNKHDEKYDLILDVETVITSVVGVKPGDRRNVRTNPIPTGGEITILYDVYTNGKRTSIDARMLRHYKTDEEFADVLEGFKKLLHKPLLSGGSSFTVKK